VRVCFGHYDRRMTRLVKLMQSIARRTSEPGRTATTAPDPGRETVVEYSPDLDGEPDPGEVVWAWVPYEEDPARGKDRPVLVIGRDGGTLLALALSSQDHDLDAEDEARHGRHWMDVGTGSWDHQRRPSEVRLDRLIRLREQAVRREGAVLDKAVFDTVVRAARAYQDP
jgi:hypothetical protein